MPRAAGEEHVAQDGRAVGHDPVDAQVEGGGDVPRVVHSPHVYLEPAPMGEVDDAAGEAASAGEHPGQLGDPRRLTHLKTVMINGSFIQPTDQIDLVVQADEWKQWEAKPSRGAPSYWDIDHVFGDHIETHLWVALKLDPASRAAAPYISIGVIEHEDRGEPYTSLAQHAATPNPELV